MKKIILGLIIGLISISTPSASAANSVVRITSVAHQTFTGEFRNDDLAQALTPSGELGLLVFRPVVKNRTWVIDPALIDEVLAMTGDYKLATLAEPIGTQIAIIWLNQLKQVSLANDVVALAYGNPDTSLAKTLAPSELRKYHSYGKDRLEIVLGRTVKSDLVNYWSKGRSGLSNTLRRNYSENRQALTRLSRVISTPEVVNLRARLALLLSPTLDKTSREFFSYGATAAVNDMVNKLRINSGNYQITTSLVKLPVTVINEFDTEVTIDLLMLPINARVIVDSFYDVVIPARSKKQLEMKVEVVAPGQTIVTAQITDGKGEEAVPAALLTVNSTVIDAKVTWFTTGAAILLLLAAVAQSVRRIRRRSK